MTLLKSLSGFADNADSAQLRQSAVQSAREGDFEEALAILEPLYLDEQDNIDLLHDYLTVLSWAEYDQRAADLLPLVDIEKAPAFVVSSAAKSLRRLGKWEAAENMYRLGIGRFPDDIDMKVGLVLTVSDRGRSAEALKIAEEFIKSHPGKNEFLSAQAYAAEAADEGYRALLAYQKVLDRDRFNRAARHSQIMLLHKIGAYNRSLELAEQYPEAVTQDEYRRLRSDADAQSVRWSSLPPVTEEKRFNECEHVLEQLEKTGSSFECRGERGKACRLQVRFDRMVALKNCSRSKEVIEEYRSLLADGEQIPAYALEVAAHAMLNTGEPETARDIYEEVISLNPESYEARIGLFFSLIETENFSQAQELIDKITDGQSDWNYPGGIKTPRANWEHLTAEIYAALARLFADDLDEAERRFTVMTKEAPANTDLLREMGSVYLARGWTRRALEVIELGQALEPHHRGLRIGHAEANMFFREYEKAGVEITDLLSEYPEDLQVQRLGMQWQLHNMRELRIDTTLSNSSGSVYGDQEWEISTTVFSRPFHNQYRWFAGLSHAQAEFPEGSGDLQSYRTGIEYSSRDLEASLAAGFNDSEPGHAGMWLDGTWHLDDYWSIPFSAEIYSRDTPLRAIHNGVRANALTLGVRYRLNERSSISLNGQIMDFSDNNFRTRFTLAGTQRLLTFPKHKLTAFGELYVSGNSRNNVPYFNPDSDLSLTGGLEHLWRIYRRYEKSFHQRLRISAGAYAQQGFGSDYTLGFEYAHILGLGHRCNLSYGAGLKRRIYDGDPEWNSNVFLSLNWRF